ncbi:MAG: MlaD family protein [Thermonemataceae bacterium]|nr:MlaD family protein [Thermonemataceae bacterium]
MIKVSKEVKVGLLGLVSLLMLYTGFNFLKGKDFFSGSHYYYILYDDVKGLAPANLVRINGVAVGRVLDVRFLQTENAKTNGKVLVSIDLNQKIKMGKNTVALLNSSLLNGTMIDLQLDTKAPFVNYDDTLKSAVMPDLLASVQEKADPVLKKADSVMLQLNQLLAEFKGIGVSTQNTLKSFEQSAKMLNKIMAENQNNILASTQNMKDLTANLNKTSQELPAIMQKVNTFADSLNKLQFAKTLEKADKGLNELSLLLTKINKGEGTMGALVKDPVLYDNLTKLTAELNKLLIDLRQNPQRYIRLRF